MQQSQLAATGQLRHLIAAAAGADKPVLSEEAQAFLGKLGHGPGCSCWGRNLLLSICWTGAQLACTTVVPVETACALGKNPSHTMPWFRSIARAWLDINTPQPSGVQLGPSAAVLTRLVSSGRLSPPWLLPAWPSLYHPAPCNTSCLLNPAPSGQYFLMVRQSVDGSSYVSKPHLLSSVMHVASAAARLHHRRSVLECPDATLAVVLMEHTLANKVSCRSKSDSRGTGLVWFVHRPL